LDTTSDEELFNETYIFVAPNERPALMKVTYYGHSCFMVEIGGSHLLFDPFITPNELANGIDISLLKPDYILVSHGHADHVADVEAIAKQSGATILSNYEVVTWFQNKGCTHVHPMNLGGSKRYAFGRVKMVPAVHSSSLPDGTYGGNPGGFVVETDGRSFYYAGDTALHYDMKLIAEEFTLDVAFLPIGDNFTMGIHDALKAADFVQAKKIIGMHYDTFPYIILDKPAALASANAHQKELLLPEIGQTIII
jgi:L-ascorbate metabolism protein UlaG (beta-lactamase superfamily)